MPSYSYVPVRQKDHTFYLTALPAGLLTRISYASVRRRDNEEGAVQRILNTSRVAGIRDFAVQMGDFPASIVLNWVGSKLKIRTGKLEIPDEPKFAQIIDGQHRVAGLAAAIAEDENVANVQIPVSIYNGLDTPQSARIFISINTEQRPAPKSLVFDLYGIAATDLIDPSAIRAGDIVSHLSTEGQPYESWIKLPNQGRQRGGIALSTAINSVKPLVEAKGILEQIGASELEIQKAIFKNFFSALKSKYEGTWDDLTNAFLYASGFIGAVDFLRSHMIDYCKNKKSFEEATISNAIDMDKTSAVLQEEVKGLGGSDAANKVRDRLIGAFKPEDSSDGFKI
ncbi:DGQHR domain-containing protein [Xanthobacter agilis]|uniref:DGQHR domain-containing protein n=1 Tax=Xanthobacter agilis TaxID=47492 RepID=UPI0037286FDE